MSKNIQMLKLFQCFSQSRTTTHAAAMMSLMTLCNMITEYGEQGLQISHAYFCFVSAFCFICKHAETKTISLTQNIVLRLFCFSFISVITTALQINKNKSKFMVLKKRDK